MGYVQLLCPYKEATPEALSKAKQAFLAKL
jgi:hypothetical protein